MSLSGRPVGGEVAGRSGGRQTTDQPDDERSTAGSGCVRPTEHLEHALRRLGLGDDARVVFERTDDGVLILPTSNDARRIYLEPTTRCNLACTTCIRHSWETGQADMDFGLFSRLVDGLSAFPNLESVHFAGFGEPLLHPRIIEMLKVLRTAGIRTEMTTNGLLLDERAARLLVEAGLGTLIVSLDGIEAGTYGAVRSDASLPHVLENLRRVARIRDEGRSPTLRLGAELVAMRSNHREIGGLLNLATDLRLDHVLISNLLPYSAEMTAETLYENGQTELPVSPWYQWHWGRDRLRLPQMRLRTERLCPFIHRGALAIAADGTVSPCYPLLHSHREYVFRREKRIERWAAGNLHLRSLTEIWTDEAYVKFRSRVRRFAFPSCPDCPSVDACYFSQSNQEDCWANSPSCADCLWSRGMILCF